MSLFSNFTFNKLDRIGADTTDNTQRNLQNSKFANYSLASYFSETITDDNIKFATQQPTMILNGHVYGTGINGHLIDNDSLLLIQNDQERPLDKLNLNQRTFLTIPFLGRGSCDPEVESKLQQGENIFEKKSVSTIMDKSFMSYSMYPTDENMIQKVKDTKFTVEESALDGWVRGGTTTRNLSDETSYNKNKKSNSGW
jgi:hypothetical protein